MVVREEDAAIQASVALAIAELNPHTVDWLAEDLHKEFHVIKTVAKMWLETKGVPDNKQ